MMSLINVAAWGAGIYSAAAGLLCTLVMFSPDPVTTPRTSAQRAPVERASMTPNLATPPPLLQYKARDGEMLAYRAYHGTGSVVVCLIHGTAGQSEIWHDMATQLSQDPRVKLVIVPNLRGHFCSGRRRGDCSYIGQLEDDCADLFAHEQIGDAPLVIVGHSGGGGLTLRYAGSAYGARVNQFVLLAPAVLTKRTVKEGNGVGWAQVAKLRTGALFGLNCLGIHGFNGLPTVCWNKSPDSWNGLETLCYSYRLIMSMMPHVRTSKDIAATKGRLTVVAGGHDRFVAPARFEEIFGKDVCVTMPDEDHASLLRCPGVRDVILQAVGRCA